MKKKNIIIISVALVAALLIALSFFQNKKLSTITFAGKNYNFYKKGTGVYFEKDLLSGVSSFGFKAVGEHADGYLIKDNKSVYLISFKMKCTGGEWNFCEIEKVESVASIKNITSPNTFKLSSNKFYGTDSAHAYAMVQTDRGGPAIVFTDTDSKSFDPLDALNSSYVKDADTVIYYHYSGDFVQKILTEADAITFKSLGQKYAKDKSHVYFSGNVLADANTQSFEIVPGTFYAKDIDSVYYFGEVLPGADSASFKMMTDNRFAEDKNNRYSGGRLCPGKTGKPICN